MGACRPIRCTDICVLTDTMCKSLHDLSYCSCLFMQREQEQFDVSLLAVHLIKVVRGVSGISLLCFSFVV